MCYELLQVGNMFTTLVEHLRERKLLQREFDIDKVILTYKDVFAVLNSPDYLAAVPRVSNVHKILAKYCSTSLFTSERYLLI